MNNKTVGVCLYGNPESINNVDLVKQKLVEKFGDNFTFFQDFTSTDQFVNLKRVSVIKRNEEINNGKLFDICLAVHVNYINFINNLFFKDVDTSTLLFVTGGYYSYTKGTGVYPWIFYSNSLIFDRACEFAYNTTPPSDRSVDLRFYYHLKTLYIDTECINIDNPILFKRIY